MPREKKNRLTNPPIAIDSEAVVPSVTQSEPVQGDERLANPSFIETDGKPLPIDEKELVVASVSPLENILLEMPTKVVPAATNVEPIIPIEMISVSKKALYKMMVALSRSQTMYYTGNAIRARIGDLLNISDVPSRDEKWEEMKQFIEADK
jgi:hypothetical protein